MGSEKEKHEGQDERIPLNLEQKETVDQFGGRGGGARLRRRKGGGGGAVPRRS
jgi:hypothetical protein